MIRYANIDDLEVLSKYDKHLSREELKKSINLNRILVMYEGEIVGEFDPKKTTPEELGLYMAGAKRKEVGA